MLAVDWYACCRFGLDNHTRVLQPFESHNCFSCRMVIKRSIIDNTFGAGVAQEILCSSDYDTPQKRAQTYRPGRPPEPWLGYHYNMTSNMTSVMHAEAGKC